MGDHVPDGEPAARVEPGGRLVQEQHRRRHDQAGREVEPAAQAPGVRPDRAPGHVGEVEAVQQLVGALAGLARRQVVQPAEHDQVRPPGEQLVHGRVLSGQPDAVTRPVGVARQVVPGDGGVPGVRAYQRGQDPHDRGLAGAVRAEQSADRAGRYGEVDPGQLELGPLGAGLGEHLGHRLGGLAPQRPVARQLLRQQPPLGGHQLRRQRPLGDGRPVAGDGPAGDRGDEGLARGRVLPGGAPDLQAGGQLLLAQALGLDRVGERPGVAGGDQHLGDAGLGGEDDHARAAASGPGEPVHPAQAHRRQPVAVERGADQPELGP